MRLIDDLVGGRYAQLSRKTFDDLVLETSNNSGVMVKRSTNASDDDTQEVVLSFTQFNIKTGSNVDANKVWTITITPISDVEVEDDFGRNYSVSNIQTERIVERELGFRRISPREWRDPSDGRIYNREQLSLLVEDHQAGGGII